MSLVCAFVMAFSMTTAVYAVAQAEDPVTVKIEDYFKLTNAGTESPAQTFSFSITKDGFYATGLKSDGEAVTEDDVPLPTVGTAVFAEGDATTTGTKEDVEITLPLTTDFPAVGIYKYIIKQNSTANTAGVGYVSSDIRLVVTVIEDENGKKVIGGVHTELDDDDDKTDVITNPYSAGTLTVEKEVTGNLGDKNAPFDITVTFTKPSGKTIGGSIYYGDKEIKPSDWKADGTVDAEITLKHGESVNFTNIPYGVTYTVVEDDYTAAADGGYDAADYDYDDDDKTIDSALDEVLVTNHKGKTPDTGIIVNNLPYIAILAVVGLGFIVFFSRRRANDEI